MIKDSARRHGIPDADMEHAVRHWITRPTVVSPDGRELIMYVGPDSAGRMIEVGTNTAGDIVHAMKARKQFLPKRKA